MATPIFEPTTTAADEEITVTDTPVTISLNAPAGMAYSPGGIVVIEIKSSDDSYLKVGHLDGSTPAQTIYGAGTYRVRKNQTPVPIGVDEQ